MREHEPEDFWREPIHVYTRQQAIADGVLVDVSAAARDVGFRLPVAMTAGAWAEAIAWEADDPLNLLLVEVEQARLTRLLVHANVAARRAGDESTVTFQALRDGTQCPAETGTNVPLKMMIGPGDVGGPVLTILLPGED